MSTVRILTANLYFHSDIEHACDLIKRERPDVIALQELCTTEEELKNIQQQSGYALAGYSHNYIKDAIPYGICTLYNAEKLKVKEHYESRLAVGLSEFFVTLFRGRKSRSVMQSIFETKDHKSVSFVNVHLSPYGTNRIRKKQLSMILETYCQGKIPTIVAGDFNFPYRRRHLEELVSLHDFKEATQGIGFTFVKKWFGIVILRFKLDYIFYRACDHIRTERLSRVLSDHYPLVCEFEL